MSRLNRFRVPLWGLLTMVLTAAAATAFAVWYYQPYEVRIGLEGEPSLSNEIMRLYAEASRAANANITITLTEPIPDTRERSQRLDARRVDVALFRLDEMLPERGAAVGFVTGETAIFVARGGSRITNMGELRERRLGLVTSHPQDETLLRAILRAYQTEPNVTVFTSDQEAREAFLRSGNTGLEAIALIARPGGSRARALFSNISTRPGGAPTVLALDESVVRVVRPQVESATIAASVLDPARAWPGEEVTSVGIRRVILASTALSNDHGAALTRFLFQRREQLAQRRSALAFLSPPSTDRGLTVPTHPGAAEYVDANEMSFYARYSDLIWIAICFSGVFGSIWGALYTKYRFSSRYGLTAFINGIAAIGKRASGAPSLSALCDIELDLADRVLAVAQDPRFAADEKALNLIQFTFEVARVAIEARRARLREDRGDTDAPVPAPVFPIMAGGANQG